MSEPIGIVGFEKAAPPAVPPAWEVGDFGFSAFLDAAAAEAAEPQPRPLPPAVTAYNSLNLLNGKFPPPDSGAGVLFTQIAMKNEAAA